MEAAGVPFYATVGDFYKEHTADLAIICTPSFLHCQQSISCLEHGSYVLCECLRANDIENFDTCTMKLTAAGIPLYFTASHVADVGVPSLYQRMMTAYEKACMLSEVNPTYI